MGLESLKSWRDRAKLKWWYKLASIPGNRYPKQLFNQEWKVKPRKGRQRKSCSKYVNDLLEMLNLNQGELFEDIKKGQCPLNPFMSSVNEGVATREGKEYEEGLNSKVKLTLYKTFSKNVEFKRFLHGVIVMQEQDSCLSSGRELMD